MRRLDLVPDCGSCAALCCVATAYDASEDFAIDKPAGVRCRYLTRGCRCAIHDELLVRGFPGCAAYDCHGAGQRVTRAFPDPSDEDRRHEAFLILRGVHELLWMLTEAAKICPPGELRSQLNAEVSALESLESHSVLDLDLQPRLDAARALLRRVGASMGRQRVASQLVTLRANEDGRRHASATGAHSRAQQPQ